MSRILFVDDEPQMLDALRFVMRRKSDWDVAVAGGADSALERLSEQPVDVVVSDMRMPGMDGAALLQTVKVRYPDAIRILLSGFAEDRALARALPVAHQFLSKPCRAAELHRCIDRIRSLRTAMRDPALLRALGDLSTLPSLPKSVFELSMAMADPSADAGSIARVIERDSGMSAKILQLANSAFFGMGRPVTRIREAVTYLGYNLVKSLALSVGIFESFKAWIPGFDPEALQQRSLAVAALGAQLAATPQDADTVFMAAVLQESGQLVLANRLADPFSQAVSLARRDKIPQHQAEQQVFGTDHAAAGAYVLGIWGLRSELVEAVARRYRPPLENPATFEPYAVLQVADRLIDEALRREARAENQPEPLGTAMLEPFGLGERLGEWQALADRVVSRGIQ